MPIDVAFRSEVPPMAVVVGATVLAWAGLYVHNIADLPGQSARSPETLYPTVVTIGCLAAFLTPATRTAGSRLLLGWTTLNLLGGALSVLPVPFLPFAPEQSLRHYAFHAVYGLCQLPLLWLCIRLVRRSSALRLSDAGTTSPPIADTNRENAEVTGEPDALAPTAAGSTTTHTHAPAASLCCQPPAVGRQRRPRVTEGPAVD